MLRSLVGSEMCIRDRWYEYKTRLAHRRAEKTLAEEATL